jgi:hypothetical protein
MMSPISRRGHRREFLRFLAASPCVAALGGMRAFAQQAPELADVITSPREALSVMDFEQAARRKVLDDRSLINYTIKISSILYFQRNTIGAALISSKY